MDLEQLKGILTDALDSATTVGRELAGVAMDKTKTAARVAKLTVEAAGEKENLKRAYVELGKAYYEEHHTDAEGLTAQLCEEVDAVSARIESIQAELAVLRSALSRAPAEDASFESVVAQDETSCDGPVEPHTEDAPADGEFHEE